jgi:putative endonuclease
VLACNDKTLYVGYSQDLKKRIGYHTQGFVKSTKYRTPLKLVYYEAFVNKQDAKSRELYLKSGYGRKQLKSILKNTSI